MSRIITIGREFGSGGREIGKRLSDELGIAYYDNEIISQIADRTKLAEGYVRRRCIRLRSGEAFTWELIQSWSRIMRSTVSRAA